MTNSTRSSSSKGRSASSSSALCCCSLFFAEFKIPFWTIREVNGNIINIPASFAPQPKWRSLLLKFIIFSWTLSVLIQDIATYEDEFKYYFIYLTHWALLLALVYLLVSLLNTVFGVAQPSSNFEKPSFMVRFAWGLFASAAANQVLITFLFWLLEHRRGEPVNYVSYMKHGVIALLVWTEGLLVNHVPVRAKHFLFVFIFDVLYFTWSIVHSALGLGNPFNEDNDPETDDDAIYVMLNWKNKPVQTGVASALILLVASPILFYILWALSMYSFPISFHGRSRRYKSSSSSGDVEMGYRRMRK